MNTTLLSWYCGKNFEKIRLENCKMWHECMVYLLHCIISTNRGCINKYIFLSRLRYKHLIGLLKMMMMMMMV